MQGRLVTGLEKTRDISVLVFCRPMMFIDTKHRAEHFWYRKLGNQRTLCSLNSVRLGFSPDWISVEELGFLPGFRGSELVIIISVVAVYPTSRLLNIEKHS